MDKSFFVTLVSVILAMTTATGVLTLGFAVTAAIHGQNLAEFYLEAFPQVRGALEPFHLHATAYAVFILYVVGAARLAIICRRRIDERLR